MPLPALLGAGAVAGSTTLATGALGALGAQTTAHMLQQIGLTMALNEQTHQMTMMNMIMKALDTIRMLATDAAVSSMATNKDIANNVAMKL